MDAKLAAGKEQILGTWKLTSFDLVTDEAHGSKQVGQPLGPTPLGRITFNSDGFMSCLLTHPDNTKPLGGPWQLASDEDISFVARTMAAYCGPYKVFSEEGEIRLSTDVEIALDPSWIGSPQVRRVTLRKEAGKGILVLRPVQPFQLADGTKLYGVLGWEKLERVGQNAKLVELAIKIASVVRHGPGTTSARPSSILMSEAHFYILAITSCDGEIIPTALKPKDYSPALTLESDLCLLARQSSAPMPPTDRATKDRARLVCTRCHDRKVKCDLQEQPSGRCRNCQRDQLECRRRVGTRKKVPQQDSPVASSPSVGPQRRPGSRVHPPPQRQEASVPADYPTPVQTSEPSQQSGFIGDLSLLSCPSDPELAVVSRVKPLPEDITDGILRLSKANSTPPSLLAKALIDIYFQELHWIVPVVSRQELSGLNPSLLLLQSVYFAGGLMRRSKIWPQSSSPEEIYKKIKTLLFLDHEKDKALVLKALCLLSIWSPNGPQVITLDCPWHWTGMALRLALQLGMHREVTYSNRSSETSFSRQLWWFLFYNETLQATCYGRPAMIRRQDCGVELPTLNDVATPTLQARASIQLPRLLVNLSSIETLNTQRVPISSNQLNPIILSLRCWIDGLENDLRLYDEGGERLPYNRVTSEIYLFYFVCIILLYLLPGPHRHSPLLCSASIVASSCIAQLYEELLHHEDVTYLLPIHGWVNLVAAVPQIYCIAKFPDLKPICDEELDITTAVLTELYNKYPSAGPVMRKISRFRQSGIAFSGLGTTVGVTGMAKDSRNKDGLFSDVGGLFPFPDTISSKIDLLRPRADEGQNMVDPNFMPFNVDEMTWTFDWLDSTTNSLEGNGLWDDWNPTGNLF
ncbi:hypothetical protein G7Y89_g3541 [Cudoniella acicularis]|uniref:Zn(2)-C6 fungal-type domain-containing protein n=1 Tax=Cudoniella acicularis TaxID=354080 RepID=A0A8H4W7J3_9HELO|nr:hypothetical protein G7Y89_g3541 [Cudoniella acicularis]